MILPTLLAIAAQVASENGSTVLQVGGPIVASGGVSWLAIKMYMDGMRQDLNRNTERIDALGVEVKDLDKSVAVAIERMNGDVRVIEAKSHGQDIQVPRA